MALLGTYLEYIGCNGKKVPNGHWKNKDNHKIYCEYLFKKLGYTTMDDWYKISSKDIQNNYGNGLLACYYNNSPIKLVTSIYPNYNWVIWKFIMVPLGYWKYDIKHRKEYMDWLGKELGYTTMDDWYKISKKDIYNNYGRGLTCYYNNSHIKLVTSIYPNYEWDKSKFINNKTEGMILRFLLNNISNLGITNDKFDQYKPDWCINPDTNRHLPYDFYIELVNGKKIIIECDGEQHYTQNSHFHRNDRTLEKQEDRDIYKMQKALDNNCSIIRVHQEEVYNDTIDWKKELTDAINEIKNENDTSIKLLGCLKDKICWILE